MAELPVYLRNEQDDRVILQRMLATLPVDLDRAEGGFLWDALAPAAIELALAAQWAQEVLRRTFAQTTFGAYLDLRADEHGLTRRAAVSAIGTVTFSGNAGTPIPSGTRVSTASSDTIPAVVFETTEATTIAGGGSVDVAVSAVVGGIAGNVGAGSVSLLASPVAGVSGVNNAAAMTGGLEKETDAALLDRYLQRVRNPSAGGNKADYVNWALEVPGVGGVSVIPVRDGPGTVAIVIVDVNRQPGYQSLLDAVQDYIAPPHLITQPATGLTAGGYGTSVDGDAMKLIYHASGAGTLTQGNLQTVLAQPGIWQARVSVKVDSIAGSNNLLDLGVYNVTNGAWAKTTPSGSTDAHLIFKANQLATSAVEKIVQYAWNGTDQLELRITRLQTDTTTTLWTDEIVYRSTFSKDDGTGKAPIGARVSVEAATSVVITVAATLQIAIGYQADAVKAAVTQSVSSYLKSLVFQSDNDVRYARIANAILDTPGIVDYSALLVNGSNVNVVVAANEIAVLGSTTWS